MVWEQNHDWVVWERDHDWAVWEQDHYMGEGEWRGSQGQEGEGEGEADGDIVRQALSSSVAAAVSSFACVGGPAPVVVPHDSTHSS